MRTRPHLPTRVVAPSTGCTARARLRLTPDEQVLLEAVGAHLTQMRMCDVKAALAGERANDRSKRLAREFGVIGRYAETACVDNDAAVKTARESLWHDRRQLLDAVARLRRRLAAPSRARCGCNEKRGCPTCRDGYATEHEWVMKRRRLDVLNAELKRVERRLTEKRFRLVLGTARLLNTRHHVSDAGLDEAGWRAVWQRSRAWFGAIGNAGKVGGNPCLTMTSSTDGQLYLTVSVPRPVAERLGVGTRVKLVNPVPFRFCDDELTDRVTRRMSTRFDIETGPTKRGRPAVWLRAAWQRSTIAAVPLDQARESGVVGVDFNADHFAIWRVDRGGNPVGAPRRVPLELAGQPARVRDGRLREALTCIIDHAVSTGVSAIAVEDLGFAIGEKSRESYRHNRGFRRLVSGFATTQVKQRLPRMAGRRGLAVIAVDPRHTSRYGGASWQRALTSGSVVVTRHEGAAVAIGRRALAHGLTARTSGQLQQRSVPHQSDGSVTGTPGQGRAPASAARSRTARCDQQRMDEGRRPPRRPPRPAATRDGPGVDPARQPTSHPHPGHRFAGAPVQR